MFRINICISDIKSLLFFRCMYMYVTLFVALKFTKSLKVELWKDKINNNNLFTYNYEFNLVLCKYGIRFVDECVDFSNVN